MPPNESFDLNESMDLAMGHALGELSPHELERAEQLLANGDPTFTLAYHNAKEALSELPSLLKPVQPPPFIKGRVSARVRDLKSFESPSIPQQSYAMSVRPTPSMLMRGVSYLQRGAVFAGLVVGMMLTTAYASDAVTDILRAVKSSREMNAKKVTHVWKRIHRDDAAIASLNQPIITEDQKVEPEPQIESASLREEKLRMKQRQLQAQNENLPDIETDPEQMQTDLSIMEADMHFATASDVYQFVLSPVNQADSGKAKLLWDTRHSDGLFKVSNLQPNDTTSNYALWYVKDDGSQEQVLKLAASSSADMAKFVRRAPARNVVGLRLTLEKEGVSTTVLKSELREKAKRPGVVPTSK